MKLRNKKTGEIVEAESCNTTTGMIGIFYHNEKGILTLGSKDCFETLADLNEEWEDYKPAEPLIKDEKVRKAVRAWAEANGLKNVAFEDYDDENCYFIDRDYEPQIWFSKKSMQGCSVDDGKIYSIAELCGEEGQ